MDPFGGVDLTCGVDGGAVGELLSVTYEKGEEQAEAGEERTEEIGAGEE